MIGMAFILRLNANDVKLFINKYQDNENIFVTFTIYLFANI